MGNMTVVVINNDETGDIEKSREAVMDALLAALRSGTGADLKGVKIHPSYHADIIQLLAVGGNFSSVVHHTYSPARHDIRTGQIEVLKSWARALGYELTPAE